MDQLFGARYATKSAIIYPNNERTRKLLKQKNDLDRQKMQEKEKQKALLDEEEKTKQAELYEKAKQKKLEEQRRLEEEKKAEEEREQIQTLKGQFGKMISDLLDNKSTADYSIMGLDLKDSQIRVLMRVVGKNKTLKTLSLCRKKISDDDGVDICECLMENTCLEKVELEGNNLGPKTAEALADLITENPFIRAVDLENNDLTVGAKEHKGIKSLAEAIAKNDSLICLNLNNTGLDKNCGKMLADAMEKNHSIIMLDIEGNRKTDKIKLSETNNKEIDMNIAYEDVIRIHQYLERNKKAYREERFDEWRERKMAKEEEDLNQINVLNDQISKEKDAFETRFRSKLEKMNNELDDEFKERQLYKEKMMHKLEKDALGRRGKGKGMGMGKGKGKGKK